LLLITLALFLLIRMKTCFLKSSFVVMLTFSLTKPDLLIILLISIIFLDNTVGNTSIQISSILVFKVCVYNFLFLMGSVDLLMFNLARLGDGVDLGTWEATSVKYDETHWQNVLFLSVLR